jgi:murein hydrolase activator
VKRAGVLAALAGVALGSVAIADEAEPTGTASRAPSTARDPRGILTAAFADQRATVERAAAAVGDKLAAAVATREARARAAYALLRGDTTTAVPTAARTDGAKLEPALAIARRRAAVKWLLARDRDELGLLADEATQLLAARQRIDRDAERAATIALPAALVWPVSGTIARKFGPFEHAKSKTTLTRRGLDLEVGADAVVIAPAAGTVRYIGPIRGLDQGVIVDHGDYLTVTAKLAAPAVHVGDAVEQGTTLGKPARRRVYFEVRVEVGPGGTPIDPETVLPPR